MMGWYRQDLSGLRKGQVKGFGEQGNKPFSLKNVRKFLSSCATGSYSGRTQLHGVSSIHMIFQFQIFGLCRANMQITKSIRIIMTANPSTNQLVDRQTQTCIPARTPFSPSTVGQNCMRPSQNYFPSTVTILLNEVTADGLMSEPPFITHIKQRPVFAVVFVLAACSSHSIHVQQLTQLLMWQ
jgi:hypothetical protein